MEVLPVNYMPGDPLFIDKIVYELKSQGMFDGFRRECMSDVDTKPAYQNLRQRVESAVNAFLRKQKWNPEMNKNHVREQLRKNLCESGFLEPGVERIVDQVVNPKTNSVFLPKVTDIVYENLGLERPNTSRRSEKNLSLSVENLLPQDLEAVSPESTGPYDDKMDSLQSLDDGKMDDDESPPFEPIEENAVAGTQEENSVDSHLSGFSGLVSHDSNQSDAQKPLPIDADTQMSKPSSDGRSSIAREEKMDVCDDSKGFEPESSDKSSSSNKSEKKEHRKEERRSDKDKDRRDKEKERSREKDKSKSDKHKSRSSSHSEKRDDKKSDRDKKDKSSSSKDKDRDRSRDSSRKDSKSSHKSSSSSKHSSSNDKKKEPSKDKDKERKEHRDSKDKKSSSKDEKSRSSSHSNDKHRKSSSSSSSRKDKDKKRRDKDDHFSSKQRPERRSTDRDSNDGSGLKSSSSSYSESNSSSQNSSHVDKKTQEVTSNSTDSGNSDAVEQQRRAVTLGPEQLSDEVVLGAGSALKLIKPKFASNIHEARRLMKIRKKLKRIEMQGEYALEALKRKEERKEVRESLSVSMDKWNELEAKLNESVNFDTYYDPESEASESTKPAEKVECNEVKPSKKSTFAPRNNGDTKPPLGMVASNAVQNAKSSVKEAETPAEVVTAVDVSENIIPLESSPDIKIQEGKPQEAGVEVELLNDNIKPNAETEANTEEEPNAQIKPSAETEVNTEARVNAELEISADGELRAEVELHDEVKANAKVESEELSAAIEEAEGSTSEPEVATQSNSSQVSSQEKTSAVNVEAAAELHKGLECNQLTDESVTSIDINKTAEDKLVDLNKEPESSPESTEPKQEPSSKVTASDKKPEKKVDTEELPKETTLTEEDDHKMEDLLYFPVEDVEVNDARTKTVLGYVSKLKREIEEFEAKMALCLRHDVPELSDVNKENKRAGVKRKTTERNESVVRKLRNNNNLVDVTAHDEKFSMPLSPAESDKSIDKKIDTETQARVEKPQPPPTVGRKKRVSKRYSSEDLYKPRPLIKRTTRTRRGAQLD